MTSFITYAHRNIWGVGATPEAAIAQATAFGGEGIELLDTVAATDRLAAAVAGFTDGHPIYPTDMNWQITDDLADLILDHRPAA
jgi:hypothetical protein